jgi:hypothetical protein
VTTAATLIITVMNTPPPWRESGGGKIERGAGRHDPSMKATGIIDGYVRPLDNRRDLR